MNRIDALNLAIRNQDSCAIKSAILFKGKIRSELDSEPLDELISQIESVTPERWQRWMISLVKLNHTPDSEEQFKFCDEMTKALSRIALDEDGWIVPPLYSSCTELKRYAVKCGLGKYMEACSRTINGALKSTMIEPNHKSTKPHRPPKNKRLGYYQIANVLLSIYFRVRAFSLANGVIASTNTQKNALVPLQELPVSHQVPWLYYSGVLKFIDQKYDQSLELLEQAFKICPTAKSQQLILFYLIPLQIYVKHMYPSSLFPWRRYPALAQLYCPLITALKVGNIGDYKTLVSKHYNFLVSKHLYLLILKLTEQVQIHLANRVWQARDKVDKIDLEDFIIAFEEMGQFEGIDPSLYLGSIQLILSTMIQSGHLMGTIFVSHGKIVLRKVSPFPYIKFREQ